jgi:hypothetical protein
MLAHAGSHSPACGAPSVACGKNTRLTSPGWRALVQSRQDRCSLTRHIQGEHTRPRHASLPRRLAGGMLSLARRRQVNKCSIAVPTGFSEDGQVRDGRQIESWEQKTDGFPCERETTGCIPLFLNMLVLSDQLFRKFFGMSHVCHMTTRLSSYPAITAE